MRKPIRIAVIVVCRNACSALQETIESIRAVADPRVRPIIIDGASTDGTRELLEGLRDWKFYFVSEPDQGIYDAMNKGWAAAPEGSLIIYLGAGDLLHALPTDDALRDSGGSAGPVFLGETHVGNMPFRSRWSCELRLRNTAHHQAMLVNKELSREPPFDPRLRVYGDWDFNLRLYKAGIRARHVPGLITYATPGGASWSMDTAEIHRVATRHSGSLVGALSRLLNRISQRRRAERSRCL